MPDGKGEIPHLGARRAKVDRDVLTHNLNDTVPPTGWESRGSPQTTPPTIEILGGENEQTRHWVLTKSQVRGGATTQSTAPPNRIVPCGKRRYLRGSEFCCGPPKAPISAAALKKEGEWRQSRKGGGRMVAVKERCQSEGKYKGRFETQSSRFSYISEAQSTP